MLALCFFFFFQAEDGIRDLYVTGVQTCALPIACYRRECGLRARQRAPENARPLSLYPVEESGARSFTVPFRGHSRSGDKQTRMLMPGVGRFHKHLLSKLRSPNRAIQLRPAWILISPTKHSRERARALEPKGAFSQRDRHTLIVATISRR